MKQKILILIMLLLLPLVVALGQRKSKVVEEKDTTAVVVRVDTVYKNATQYSLDSLKYASLANLEKIKNERYKDSMVYAQMSADRLYVLQMKKENRFYRTTEEELFNGPILPLTFFTISIIAIVWLILWAREKNKRRQHEYRMAQLEKGLQEKIIIREVENRVEVPVERPVYIHDTPKNDNVNSAEDEAMPKEVKKDSSFTDYLRGATVYRKRGIMLIYIGVAIMILFWSFGGFNSPWGLGFIPMFIGLAYLYMDFTTSGKGYYKTPRSRYVRYEEEDAKAKEEKTPDTEEKE